MSDDEGIDPRPEEPLVVITRRTLRRAGIIAAAVVVLGGVGIGAYLAGRASVPYRGVAARTLSHGPSSPTTTGPMSSTATSAPESATTTTSGLPPTTTTNPAFTVLSPATVPPALPECNETIQTSADGNASPLLCPSGGPNIQAWNWYARSYRAILALGPSSSESTAIATMCAASVPFSEVQEAGDLAAAYYGWPFAQDSAFKTWDVDRSTECPS